MKLRALLENGEMCPKEWDREIKGLALHSQHVQSGDLFIARQGQHQDGHRYIQDAINNGAVAILCETNVNIAEYTVPVIVGPVDLQTLTTRFYGNVSATLNVTGVTGTNGKTTTTFLLAQALSRLGCPTAVVGTLGYGSPETLMPTGLTTPDSLSLHKYFFELKEKGFKAIAMEVSSHGLAQNRTQAICFKSALFTNLSQDHLDYHITMEEYGKIKQRLFQTPYLERAIINGDSDYAEKIIMATRRDLPIIVYSCHPSLSQSFSKERNIAFVMVETFSQTTKGLHAKVNTPWGKAELRSPLLGEFNLSNLLGVLSELCSQGFALNDVCEALSHAVAPPGRMQRLGGGRHPLIIIDYAHTPDALKNALKAAKVEGRRKLWCVFGCGGDRDSDKRAVMGNIAGQWADKIVLTSDNPRTEEPKKIIDNILNGIAIEWMDKVVVEESRQCAIEYALNHALPVDTVLIAGKGHEDYQIIGVEKLPFSDVACVEQLLGKR